MTDVAVVGFAQSPCARRSDSTTSGVEMLVPIFGEVLAAHRPDQERHRLLVLGLLGLPGRPGVLASSRRSTRSARSRRSMESHVEMDAAWALYEAWLKVLHR